MQRVHGTAQSTVNFFLVGATGWPKKPHSTGLQNFFQLENAEKDVAIGNSLVIGEESGHYSMLKCNFYFHAIG